MANAEHEIVKSFLINAGITVAFSIVLLVMVKQWIKDMFRRYNSHEIHDIGNMFHEFRWSLDFKMTIMISYIVIALLTGLIVSTGYSAVSTWIQGENLITCMNDVESLNYQARLQGYAIPTTGEECVQEDSEAGGDDSKD